MDKETLANHLINCGKREFEIACKLLLQEVFNLDVVNVDGANDGGADFIAFEPDGTRKKVAYQITTQKTDIKKKAYKDAQKGLNKLGIKKYYFLCSYNLSEVECRSLEETISSDLDLPAVVYSPAVISGLMINHKLVKLFFERIGFNNCDHCDKNKLDYRETALHSYSFLSKDAKDLKKQIYDDSLLLVLSDYPEGLEKKDIIDKTINMLALPSSKEEFLSRRIDSLMGKQWILKKKGGDTFVASPEMLSDIIDRKTLYDKELDDLFFAQKDLFNRYDIEWTKSDARQASVWIANTYMGIQLIALESANASLADNFFSKIDKNGRNSLKDFLKKEKKVRREDVDKMIDELLQQAVTYPLIKKITSASVYLALEGSNPIMACKAIGVESWSNMKMLLEPTLGIPYLCSLLYSGKGVNYYFDNAIGAVIKCRDLGISIKIPSYYIKECAGHLHMARKFDGLELDPMEMQYSSNAFVSNYYALKTQGVSMPSSFLDYLATFSAHIRVQIPDYHEWIKLIMVDIQSLFIRDGGIDYLDVPKFSSEELKSKELSYNHYIEKRGIQKSHHLMFNDALSLTYTDHDSSRGSHWMILTNDRVLIEVAKDSESLAWVTSPFIFNELVQMSKDLNEKELSSMVHSMASFRSPTFDIGARILDRIVLYASDKMQNWEFIQAMKKFKSDIIDTISEYGDFKEIDKRTVEFLAKHGVNIDPTNEQNDVDIEVDNINSLGCMNGDVM